MKRQGAEHQITISSAKRDRCIAEIAAAQELEREVAVRHRIQRIGGRPLKAERLGRHVPIDRERRAGQRGATQRAFIQTAPCIGKPAAVAIQHLDIGQQMVPERHRLRGLQMSEARHRIAGMRSRAIGQRTHHVGDLFQQPVDRVAHPETEVCRHLVIAAACRVQAAARIADALGKAGLDVHVDVFERDVEGKAPHLDLLRDRG